MAAPSKILITQPLKSPPPKGKKVAHRKRVTTPDAAQSDQSQQPAQPAQSAQQAPGAFPAPMPSGSFTR